MSSSSASDHLTIALAQIAPVWLDRAATLDKIIAFTREAAGQGARFIAFGEALLPGYPFWIELTDGARFDSPLQKEIHAHYLAEAVDVAAADLAPLQAVAAERGIAVMLGCMERAADRGGHSLYCSRVHIGADGTVASVHRKLMPTYEERLSWAPGDGHGLRVHPLGRFTVGGLNCWENWMPLARAALYAQGEDLHVMLWPGNLRNTQALTPVVAREARSYVISVSGLMRRADVPATMPGARQILQACPEVMANGGSCIAGPDGDWVVAPITGEERLALATLDHAAVRRERQNFDPSGHYARPDVLRLTVNRERQSVVRFED